MLFVFRFVLALSDSPVSYAATTSGRVFSLRCRTVLPGGTERVTNTLPLIVEPRPMTVSPPRIVAPA